MSKLPNLTPRKVIALLKRKGFILDHTTGSHYVFYHPETKRRTMVAYHMKDILLCFYAFKLLGITPIKIFDCSKTLIET